MSKRQITKVFVGSLIAMLAGLVLTGVGIWLAVANDVLVTDGPDVVGVDAGAAGWLLVSLAIVGTVVVIAAAVSLLVSWVAALVNTAQLPDKTWFVVLLVTGLISVGIVGMVIYLVAGPDDALPTPPAQQWTVGAGR